MPITKISPRHQITILNKLVPKDQAWFWTKEWQAKEKEAGEAIARGEISEPFENAEESIWHLSFNKDGRL